MHGFRSRFKGKTDKPTIDAQNTQRSPVELRNSYHMDRNKPLRLSLDFDRSELAEIYSSPVPKTEGHAPSHTADASAEWSSPNKTGSVFGFNQGTRVAEELQSPHSSVGAEYPHTNAGVQGRSQRNIRNARHSYHGSYGGGGRSGLEYFAHIDSNSSAIHTPMASIDSREYGGYTPSSPSHLDTGIHRTLPVQPIDTSVHRSPAPPSAPLQSIYGNTPTARRHSQHPSISTVLSAGANLNETPRKTGPPSVTSNIIRSCTTPRNSSRPDRFDFSRRNSQADFDSFNGRSISNAFSPDSFLTRTNFDDSSMFAHTPARDSTLAALHVMGRKPAAAASMNYDASFSGNTGADGNMQEQRNSTSPTTKGFSRPPVTRNSSARRSSVLRDGDDMHRHTDGRSASMLLRSDHGSDAALLNQRIGTPLRRGPTTQTWYEGHSQNERARRDAFSDTIAWGTPQTGRVRGSSFAVSATGNTIMAAPETNAGGGRFGRSVHRMSYTGTAGSSATSRHRDARAETGESTPSGASGALKNRRKTRKQNSTAKTPIKSNWYYKEEILSEDDIKDQEFSSSDEEDFGKEDRGYGGDLVSQQKLIQKQQREIFDLGMRNKMLSDALGSKTDQPYDELLDRFGRTCASNRRANRMMERLKSEIEDLKATCTDLENQVANPPPCPLVHGMTADEREQFEALETEVDSLRQQLDEEAGYTAKLKESLAERDAHVRHLEEEVTREKAKADRWQLATHRYSAQQHHHHQHADNSVTTPPTSAGCGPEGVNLSGNASADSSPYRARAGTATTTSETVTLRASSDTSGPDDRSVTTNRRFTRAGSTGGTVVGHERDFAGILSSSIPPKYERLTMNEAVNLLVKQEGDITNLKRILAQKEKELKQMTFRVHDYESQKRELQIDLEDMENNNRDIADEYSEQLAFRTNERDSLREECNNLKQQLCDVQAQLKRHAELVFGGDKSDDDQLTDNGGDDEHYSPMEGNVAQRAEVVKLKIELKHSNKHCDQLSQQVQELASKLKDAQESTRAFTHEHLRPFIRDMTVGPTQAESVDSHIRKLGYGIANNGDGDGDEHCEYANDTPTKDSKLSDRPRVFAFPPPAIHNNDDDNAMKGLGALSDISSVNDDLLSESESTELCANNQKWFDANVGADKASINAD